MSGLSSRSSLSSSNSTDRSRIADLVATGFKALDIGDFGTAFRTLRAPAEDGDSSAQLGLGLIYGQGFGAPQDYIEAVKWYRRSAEQGLAEAQFQLGLLYKAGLGVPADYTKSANWFFRAAAEQGHAQAQYIVGEGFASVVLR